MSTRRARVRRRPLPTLAAASVCLATLMLGSARVAVAAPIDAGSPVHAACDLGLLGICVVPSPSVAALPTTPPAPMVSAPAPTLAAPSALAAPATAVASAAAGIFPSAPPAPAAPIAVPVPTPRGCTVDLLGSCVTLLPGTTTAASSGTSSGISVSLPLGGSSTTVLALGGSSCVAAVAGVCAAATGQSSGTAAQGCTVTLLTVCVPGSGDPTTCVLNGVACVAVPGASPSPGGSPAPVTNGGAPTQRSTSVSSASPVTSSTTSAGAAAAGVASGQPGGGAPDAAVTAPVGTVSTPPVPATGLLAQLGGLHLGSLLLWPVFAGLDLLAALALVAVVRRSWSAAAAD